MAEHKLKEKEALQILKTVDQKLVPETMEQAATLMLEIDANDRATEQLLAEAEARVADIIGEIAPKVMTSQESCNRKIRALYAFARSKRDELDTKTMAIGASGSVSWKKAVDTIEISDEDAAIAHCKKMGLIEFFETKTETVLKKDVLKQNPDITRKIPGVAIEVGTETVTIKTADPLKGLKGKLKDLTHEPDEDQPTAVKKPRKKAAPAAEPSLPGQPR